MISSLDCRDSKNGCTDFSFYICVIAPNRCHQRFVCFFRNLKKGGTEGEEVVALLNIPLGGMSGREESPSSRGQGGP